MPLVQLSLKHGYDPLTHVEVGRALAGLREPDAGHVTVQGRALVDWPLEELARERAFLAQARHDAFSYRVIETVLSARHPYHDSHYWEGSDDQRIA